MPILASAIVRESESYRANRATALAMLGRKDEAKAEYLTVLSSAAATENLATLDKARKEQESPTQQ